MPMEAGLICSMFGSAGSLQKFAILYFKSNIQIQYLLSKVYDIVCVRSHAFSTFCQGGTKNFKNTRGRFFHLRSHRHPPPSNAQMRICQAQNGNSEKNIGIFSLTFVN